MTDGLRVAILGCRGVPACWTGFETFAEELTVRLVELGHDVTVYARKEYAGEQPGHQYKGVKLIYTPYLKQREAERLSHEAVSILDSLRRPFDIYYVMGYPSAPLYYPLRALSRRRLVVINTDGLEWRRPKWGRYGRMYMKVAEWAAMRGAADYLVSDARAMRQYFLDRYQRDSEFLTNGAYVMNELPDGALDQWGVSKGDYYLVACRIEPDNNIHWIIREFIASGSRRELVIAGGMNYETPFWQYLQEMARGHRVRFLGPVYGPMLVEKLHLGCFAYLHGHQAGGTNPSLLKAMGCANLAIAFNSPFNTEVLAGTGLIWEKAPDSLASQIRWAESHPVEARELGRRAQDRIRQQYTWDQVARDHDRFFRRIARERGIGITRIEDREDAAVPAGGRLAPASGAYRAR
jgi:glycosyltransferase involved in cell wall biosynthesis